MTVCLLLGPDRNLTTLTSATLFLHPRCQILNHQASQFFDNPAVDFVGDPTAERLAAFLERVEVVASREGSVLESHAFRPGHPASASYRALGLQRARYDIHSLVWKESLRVTSRLREAPDLVDGLLELDDVRFLMPVRSPLDCARSNLANGHVHLFDGLYRDSPVLEVVAAILDMVEWFHGWAEQHPGRFLQFYEHELSSGLLREIAAFLGLVPTENWLAQAVQVFRSRSSPYTHRRGEIAGYEHLVRERFEATPSLRDPLLALTRPSAGPSSEAVR